MPPGQRCQLEKDLLSDNQGVDRADALFSVLAKTQVENAKASVETDRTMILDMIASSCGYHVLNTKVNEILGVCHIP